MTGAPLLEVRDLTKHFAGRRGLRGRGAVVRAVDGVSFTLFAGSTLAVVGESGSGKTTLARCVVGALRPSGGSVIYQGNPVSLAERGLPATLRRQVQMVFQDPSASLNPRLAAGAAIAEGIRFHRLRAGREAVRRRVVEILDLVGLGETAADRLPHQLSGGQRQRVAIARALAVEPSLIVCDEAVSALDVSIQAQVLNLLQDLQEELGLAYLFVTHDLGVVRHVADDIVVMYRGRVVESGPARRVLDEPRHPYTELLLGSVPVPDPAARAPWGGGRAARAETGLDDAGCAFAPRCPIAVPDCTDGTPALSIADGHGVACFERAKEE
jgi:peptide/nickel transport system ATP-binding protein